MTSFNKIEWNGIFKLMRVVEKYFPFIWFYIGWFGCVYSSQYGLSAWSLFFPVCLLGFHAAQQKLNIKIMVILFGLALVGIAFDGIMAWNQWIIFVEQQFAILPLWLISIWLLFVLVLPTMTPVFHRRLWLGAVLGAIFGPTSYASGKLMGVMSLEGPLTPYFYAAFWSLYFPLAIHFVYQSLQQKNNIASGIS